MGSTQSGPGPTRSPPRTPDSAPCPPPDHQSPTLRRRPGAPADHAEPAMPPAHRPTAPPTRSLEAGEDHRTTLMKDRGCRSRSIGGTLFRRSCDQHCRCSTYHPLRDPHGMPGPHVTVTSRSPHSPVGYGHPHPAHSKVQSLDTRSP